MGSRSRTGHASVKSRNTLVAERDRLKRALKRRKKKLHVITMMIGQRMRERHG